MSTPAPLFSRFGQALAFAEQALTASLHEHLAHRDVTPGTWYALKLVSIPGRPLDRAALDRALKRSRNLDPDTTHELIARLEADGLIRGDARVEFTAEGEARYRSLNEYVTAPTIRLLSQFDAHDVETTVRTLEAVAQRNEQQSSEADRAEPSIGGRQAPR
ncbi:MAG TPA: hypothetical protein VGE11_07545 [Pseudonocardia sp.]